MSVEPVKRSPEPLTSVLINWQQPVVLMHQPVPIPMVYRLKVLHGLGSASFPQPVLPSSSVTFVRV